MEAPSSEAQQNHAQTTRWRRETNNTILCGVRRREAHLNLKYLAFAWHGQYRGATISQFNNQYRSQIHTLSAPRRSAFLLRITESVFRELLGHSA